MVRGETLWLLSLLSVESGSQQGYILLSGYFLIIKIIINLLCFSNSVESGEEKNERETNGDKKPTSEHDRPETPDRRHDSKSRERDRERELKREKERVLERYEREAERDRIRKEREQKRRIEEVERQFELQLKEWEYREREKEKERQYEKEKEKDRERKRRKEILYDEEDDDGDSRKRWRRNAIEEKRKKRLREKEDDLADKQKEEEEIAEAKKRTEEDQQLKRQRDALKLLTEHIVNGRDETMATREITNEMNNIVAVQDTVADFNHEGRIGNFCNYSKSVIFFLFLVTNGVHALCDR